MGAGANWVAGFFAVEAGDLPAVLAAVKATSLLLEGDPMGQLSVWLAVQVCFDLIYWSLCGLLFARGVEA